MRRTISRKNDFHLLKCINNLSASCYHSCDVISRLVPERHEHMSAIAIIQRIFVPQYPILAFYCFGHNLNLFSIKQASKITSPHLSYIFKRSSLSNLVQGLCLFMFWQLVANESRDFLDCLNQMINLIGNYAYLNSKTFVELMTT